MREIIFSALCLIVGQDSFAQTHLPVIKASSKVVSIRDGMHFRKDIWYIMPEKKPDYYFVEIPDKEHKVTFITDLDSITFNVNNGEQYDFIILLNNKDSCHTRIKVTQKEIISYKRKHSFGIPDTIPFTIGDNSKIYFKARLNNSDTLNVQFDLGAGGYGGGIKKSSVKKVKMNFDGSLTLHNSDGSNVVPSSSTNVLEIAGVQWDSLLFMVADNYTHREDLLVGNGLFQNKVVEIDYDKKIIIVHDAVPFLDPSYSKHQMILDGGIIPYIQGSFTVGSKTKKGWFMFDTGAYTTILSTSEVSTGDKLLNEFWKMLGLKSGESAELSPQLTIGDYAFSNFNYTIEKASSDDARLGLLGNDLLKRFNVVIDNREGYMYLKPNSLVNEAYANPEYYLVRIVTIALVLVTCLTVFVIYRKRRNRKASANILS